LLVGLFALKRFLSAYLRVETATKQQQKS